MTSAGPGRPRKQQPVRPGATARDEILDAAAELFTRQGYANTSTRAIADAVGIRQSSLYHHFATKDDLLSELLDGTVAGGLAFARAALDEVRSIDAAASGRDGLLEVASRLHAVALYDGTQLCDARWNLGVLYHLPEARDEKFQSFTEDRRELRQIYRDLGRRIGAGTDTAGELTFRLVESLINLRADGLLAPGSALQAADAGLQLAGMTAELPAIRDLSSELVGKYRPAAGGGPRRV